jgi:hypothetical protein
LGVHDFVAQLIESDVLGLSDREQIAVWFAYAAALTAVVGYRRWKVGGASGKASVGEREHHAGEHGHLAGDHEHLAGDHEDHASAKERFIITFEDWLVCFGYWIPLHNIISFIYDSIPVTLSGGDDESTFRSHFCSLIFQAIIASGCIAVCGVFSVFFTN